MTAPTENEAFRAFLEALRTSAAQAKEVQAELDNAGFAQPMLQQLITSCVFDALCRQEVDTAAKLTQIKQRLAQVALAENKLVASDDDAHPLDGDTLAEIERARDLL